MAEMIFKTDCQKEREARDRAIYDDYNSLMAVKGQSKMMVIQHLMGKYNVHSMGTIYVILKRVEESLKTEEVIKLGLTALKQKEDEEI